MTDKPEILFLAHRIPYPPNKGDKIRSWQLLQHLTDRFDVHLGCFIDDPDDRQYEQIIRAICMSAKFVRLNPALAKLKSVKGFLTGAPLSVAYYQDQEMTRWVREVRTRPLVAEFGFSSSMAQYLEPVIANRSRFIDLCDADSAKWQQYAQEQSGLMSAVYGREATLLKQRELNIVRSMDASFVISAAEASVFDGGLDKLHWFGNGVDSDFFDPAAAIENLPDGPEVVFVGAMDYWANINSVQWFVHDIWPFLRKQDPSLRFVIVGSRPTIEVKNLGTHPGVSVTGRVDDVRPYLKSAKVVVAPMRIARGIQNKVLEAMAMGKPIVATRAAAEGLEVTPGHDIVLADEREVYAKSVLALLKDQDRATQLGAAARRNILDQYTWSKQLARLDDVMDPILNS